MSKTPQSLTSADVLRLSVADSTYEKRNEKWVGVGTNLFRGWTYGINPNECQLLDRIAADAAELTRVWAILDRVQDNLALMNRSGELSDAAYEKFYEVIPHSLWEAWHNARAITTTEPTHE